MYDIPPSIANSRFRSKQINVNCSEDDELISVSTLRKILKEETRLAMKEEFEVTVIPTFDRMIGQLQQAKEQIEFAARNIMASVQSNRENELYTSQPRRLSLQFRNGLSLPILTGKEIKGEGCDFIEVALVDDISGKIVESEPEASAVVEIVPLALNGGEGETSEQFDNMIVGGRLPEKSLLAGDVVLTLNKGIGTIRNVKFRNSSTWMKQNLFKLCARVVGSFNGIHIKEAKTSSFTVKDCRNEYYKKSDFPVLSDEIWRLKNIAKNKDIHERLQKENINTVEKFLLELFKDPDRLRDIAKMRPKNWEITVKHAQTCVDAKRISCYDDPKKKLVVLFNLVKQVLGVISGGQYIQTENLSTDEKEFARKLVVNALDNRKEVVSFDDESSVLHYFSSLHSSWDPAFSQWRDHNEGHDVETSRMVVECHRDKSNVFCQDICSAMNSAQDTTTDMHSVPEDITDRNVMDNEAYTEHVTVSQAPESLSTQKLSDNEKECTHKLVMDALNNEKDIVSRDDENLFLRYFYSLYASVDPPSAQQMDHSNGKNTEVDRLTDECSHYTIKVSCQDVCSTTNSTQATPREKVSVPENINYFNVTNNQLETEHLAFSQATETPPLEPLSDNGEVNARARTCALDNWKNDVVFNDEASLHRDFASLHPSTDPTSPRTVNHIRGKNVEEPGIFSQCNCNVPSISPKNILPPISSAEGTSSEMHPNQESSKDLNVIDDKFLMEISGAYEDPEDELLTDDDTFSLYSSFDHTSSPRLEPPEGLESESFGTTGQFYGDAFSKYHMPSIGSVGATPSKVHSGSLSIIDSYMTDYHPLTKHAALLPSLEKSQLTATPDTGQGGSPLCKKWYTLINVLSLTQKLRCLPNSLVPPKKRRLH